ncbi:uncharacterized protein LOC114526446 [Dendronephthya gigantea]|uniref:uncharacterized protein LOC114526446 n=1 Tax=Dendronephthya gigantea TaxID=151771 RepID=UPI00106D2A6E|nr:uncharacterized protein LOC114526446 [Dendronephthya gigantea]
MDYKVIENGASVWYKLLGGNELPKKGRCAKGKALYYEGMLVVPDNATAKKIPSVEGMIVYRKDNNKLYVQGDNKLNALAEEKKIIKILDKDIAKLESKFDSFNKTLNNKIHSRYILASTVLNGQPESFLKQLKAWFSFNNLRCCWRASLDGWDSHVFHSRCDYRGKTITLVKVGNYIFGGYSPYYWGGSSGSYRSSSSSYVFSLRNKYNLSPFRSDVYRYSSNAIYTNPSYGPTFGGGHDIYISSNANKNRNSYSNFGHTYRPPSGYGYGNSNTKALLAGSYYFTPTEVEVYYYV